VYVNGALLVDDGGDTGATTLLTETVEREKAPYVGSAFCATKVTVRVAPR
jgi:hypothetical protein